METSEALIIPAELARCLPERLHPVSQMFLEYWLRGEFTTAELMRWFHMPNSNYLEVTECLLRAASQSL